MGLMLTRESDLGVRLCVNQVEEQAFFPWLRQLFPDSEVGSFREVFDTIAPLCRHLAFGFNLTKDGVGAGIGMECYQEWCEDNPAQWRPLLDELVRKGLCLPEKSKGVQDYAGISTSPLSARITHDMCYIHTYRKIHHLKLSFSKGIPTQAKAYHAVHRPGVPLSLLSGNSFDADNIQAGQAWSIH